MILGGINLKEEVTVKRSQYCTVEIPKLYLIQMLKKYKAFKTAISDPHENNYLPNWTANLDIRRLISELAGLRMVLADDL